MIIPTPTLCSSSTNIYIRATRLFSQTFSDGTHIMQWEEIIKICRFVPVLVKIGVGSDYQ